MTEKIKIHEQKQEIMKIRRFLKKRFLEQSYLKSEESFTLSTGAQSKDFFDMKQVSLDPPVLSQLTDYIRIEMIPSLMDQQIPDAIGGPAIGAIPTVVSLCMSYFRDNEEVFPVIVRKEKKGYGTEHHVEATKRSDTALSFLLIDDVLTSGVSLVEAIRILREFGFKVDHCITIINRQEGGEEKVIAEGVRYKSIFTADEFRNLDSVD